MEKDIRRNLTRLQILTSSDWEKRKGKFLAVSLLKATVRAQLIAYTGPNKDWYLHQLNAINSK